MSNSPTVPITVTSEQRTGPDGQVGSEQWLVFHVPEGLAVDMPEPGTKIENPDAYITRNIRNGAGIEWQHPSGAVIGRATIVDRESHDDHRLNYVMDNTEDDARLLLADLAEKYGACSADDRWHRRYIDLGEPWRFERGHLREAANDDGSVVWLAELHHSAGGCPDVHAETGVTPIHAATRLAVHVLGELPAPLFRHRFSLRDGKLVTSVESFRNPS